jgi:hypothetical protein
MNRRIRSRTYGGVRGRGLKGPLLLDYSPTIIYKLTLRKKASTERTNERQSTADYSSPNSQGVGFRRNLCILPFIFSLC